MNQGLQNRWTSSCKNADEHSNSLLQNLSIKQIEFNNQNNSKVREVKNIIPKLPTKIVYNGYQALQMKNKRMLPGLPLKPINMSKKNNQQINNIRDKKIGNQKKNIHNFQILNSIICNSFLMAEILKTDPDRVVESESKHQRIRNSPTQTNQFIQSRDIASVKNSRGPKIIANQIMMLGNPKRKLVSQQKRRPKVQVQESYSLNKNYSNRTDPYQVMQMTFYNPAKLVLNEHSNINVYLKKGQGSQRKKL